MEKNTPWGNRVVGLTDELHFAREINAETLKEDPNEVSLDIPCTRPSSNTWALTCLLRTSVTVWVMLNHYRFLTPLRLRLGELVAK